MLNPLADRTELLEGGGEAEDRKKQGIYASVKNRKHTFFPLF